MPPSFAGRSAYVEIVGPEGLAYFAGLRFGLFLQTSKSLYPPHNHAAEEFYYVLSGTAYWQKGDSEYVARSPGTLIHHAPWERHSMQTKVEPLLAMWAWTGGLNFSTYRIDDAWPRPAFAQKQKGPLAGALCWLRGRETTDS